MKAVLLSIRPEWCQKIFGGEKTIEVRKTVPNLETPFTVYVYQTKHKGGNATVREVLNSVYGGGKVIGSFVCDRVEEYEGEFWDDDTYERIQEPWEPSDFAEYGEYEYDTIGENGEFYGKGIELSKQSCLSWNELRKYVGQGLKDFYGWHITEPKLFDKPKMVTEFAVYGRCAQECSEYDICMKYDSEETRVECPDFAKAPLKRAPQSWCYVEEI
jgi:hypothetical protein